MLTSLSHGPTWPAVQDLAIDAAGNLWLEMPQSLDAQGRGFARQFGIDVEPSPSQWIILSPEGQPISTLELPLGFELLEAGADYVLGMWHDEYGVQHLQRYQLYKN